MATYHLYFGFYFLYVHFNLLYIRLNLLYIRFILLYIRFSNIFEDQYHCREGEKCELMSSCPSFQLERRAWKALPRGSQEYSDALDQLKKKICNKESQMVCCAGWATFKIYFLPICASCVIFAARDLKHKLCLFHVLQKSVSNLVSDPGASVPQRQQLPLRQQRQRRQQQRQLVGL